MHSLLKTAQIAVLSIGSGFLSECTLAQGPTRYWYFGNDVGLDFATTPPTMLYGSSMNAHEGSTTMSSAQGELLFYSRGDTLWNAQHEPMANGMQLPGHRSSTQSALTVPFPGDPNKYYVFTTGALEAFEQNQLHAALVDMDLDGGLGDVTLVTEVGPDTLCEKLTAVQHPDGVGYWVLVHKLQSDQYLAYRINAGGSFENAVVSPIGAVLQNFNGPTGQMKFSPNGDMVATACQGNVSDVQLFHFNGNTGYLSDPITIILPSTYTAYGVEFSSDGRFLYVSTLNSQRIYQYDLMNWSESAIASSAVLVGTTSAQAVASLQIGPDGRIYVAQGPSPTFGYGRYLGVIQQPGEAGVACGYLDLAFDFGAPYVRFGLPGFVQSYFKELSPIGISDAAAPNDIGLPTLFSDVLRVNITADNMHHLRVLSADGRVMVDVVLSMNETVLDASSWSSGPYVLQVFDNRGALVRTGKAIKAR